MACNVPAILRTSDFQLFPRFRAAVPAAAFAAMAFIMPHHALAQSNGVPGIQDYAQFSNFILSRNIFDPDRQPHSPNAPIIHHTTRHTPEPGIRFVGTMSYAKGTFAFFSGNSSEWSKVVQVGDQFQNFTITSLCATNVVLEATNHIPIYVALGSGLKRSNGQWVGADASEIVTGASTGEAASSSTSSSSGSESPALPAGMENNDILKRLIEQRKKENQ